MPIGIGTAIGLGSSLLGGLLSSNATSNAAGEANAANQAAISEARARATQGYTTNKGTIAQTGVTAGGYIDQGYGTTKEMFRPLIADGDQARTYYNNAAGINGEPARDQYMQQLMARPEYAAARDLSTRQMQQQYGSKLGSGAFARSLQKKDMEYANTNIDRDLSRVKPIVDTGNQARYQQANAATNWGNNQAQNTWKTGEGFVGNENAFTGHMMNAALASGSSNASQARADGNSQAQLFSGLGNAFGAAFGGVKNQAPFSSIFS